MPFFVLSHYSHETTKIPVMPEYDIVGIFALYACRIPAAFLISYFLFLISL